MQLIDFDTYPDTTFNVDLELQPVSIRLTWNETSQAWYMAVANTAGVEVVGLKVVPSYPLMDCCRAEAPISGDFVCYRKEELAPARIGYEDLGTSWGLCWLNEAELDQWMVDNGLG